MNFGEQSNFLNFTDRTEFREHWRISEALLNFGRVREFRRIISAFGAAYPLKEMVQETIQHLGC
jgi:hypothetical protein